MKKVKTCKLKWVRGHLSHYKQARINLTTSMLPIIEIKMKMLCVFLVFYNSKWNLIKKKTKICQPVLQLKPL